MHMTIERAQTEGYRHGFAGTGQSLARDFASYRGDAVVDAWLAAYGRGLRDYLASRKST
jgi:ribosome modulation factor